MNINFLGILMQILLSLSLAVILAKYFESFLTLRKPVKMGWLFFGMYQMLSYFIDSAAAATILWETAILLVIAVRYYTGGILEKVLLSVTGVLIYRSVEGISTWLWQLYSEKTAEVLGFLLARCGLLLLLLLYRIAKHQESIKIFNGREYWVRLLYVLLAGMFTIYGVFKFNSASENDLIFAALCSVMVLFIIYTTFLLYVRINRELAIQKQHSIYQQELRACIAYLNEKKNLNEAAYKIRHDLKNQYIYLKGLIDSGDQEQASGILQRMLTDAEQQREISRTNCLLIDTIINYKYSAARKANIQFTANTAPLTPSKYDQTLELTTILGNALDNAIEASKKVPREKRMIELSVSENKGILSIIITNNYCGLLNVSRQGGILSSKKAPHHGFGLLSIQEAVQNLNGEVRFDHDDSVFVFSLALFL